VKPAQQYCMQPARLYVKPPDFGNHQVVVIANKICKPRVTPKEFWEGPGRVGTTVDGCVSDWQCARRYVATTLAEAPMAPLGHGTGPSQDCQMWHVAYSSLLLQLGLNVLSCWASKDW